VLTLVAAGMTNPQIADRLYISPRTVKGHLETLLRKTGSTGRTQLATLAAANGLTQATSETGRKNRPPGRCPRTVPCRMLPVITPPHGRSRS